MNKSVFKKLLVFVVIISSIFLLTGCGKNNNSENNTETDAYLQPLKDYMDGLKNKDVNLTLKAFPEFMNKDQEITIENINEMYTQYESLYGANIQLDYEFGTSTKLEESEIFALEEQIKGYYTEMQEIDITEAYIVPLKLTVSGDGIKDENTTTEENQTGERASKTDTTDFYVYKYNGAWYLI